MCPNGILAVGCKPIGSVVILIMGHYYKFLSKHSSNCFTSVRPSFQNIFRHIFLSNYWWQKSVCRLSWFLIHIEHIFLNNYWWQKSGIWSQASYRYLISWETFLDPSDSYFLFADFVDFYTYLTYICICKFFVALFSATIDDRNLIFGHKLHIGIPYCGKRFWIHRIPTSCLPILLIFIHIEHIC